VKSNVSSVLVKVMLHLNALQKKTMILRGVDHYSSQDEQESESETSSEESNNESKEIAYPCEGDLLMIRRLLSN